MKLCMWVYIIMHELTQSISLTFVQSVTDQDRTLSKRTHGSVLSGEQHCNECMNVCWTTYRFGSGNRRFHSVRQEKHTRVTTAMIWVLSYWPDRKISPSKFSVIVLVSRHDLCCSFTLCICGMLERATLMLWVQFLGNINNAYWWI